LELYSLIANISNRPTAKIYRNIVTREKGNSFWKLETTCLLYTNNLLCFQLVFNKLKMQLRDSDRFIYAIKVVF